jgi:hypothetical protein
MASVADRNARLDALVQAATQWATSRTNTLQNQVAVLKAILVGRTGSERLAQTSVSATSDLVVSSINDFLVAK